ncbi:putative repeat protein (TIGR01451 family) [Halarchaeum solikamskense]|uniref:DUF58 domain-containing protein n=1 Tax=Halarchaeum nitratireducens TaxID=489913 RepID=UPI001B3A8214|nr:DUF58 domain-containing protein [Halarchaeum solikamskense]MBP2251093.1 putative repeat protein (TIGR01451 family) [Halarchaeum solikamskense]
MTGSRRPLLVVGLVASLLGVCLLVAPTLGSGFTPTGVGRTAPFALGGVVVLLLAGVYFLTDVLSSSTDQGDDAETQPPETPTPERRPHYESLGESFARRLDGISWTDRREAAPTARIRLRDDLREMARRALTDSDHRSRNEIESRLDTGTWTADSDAAAFFTGDIVPELSIRQRLRSLWSPEAVFARRARHAVAALANRTTNTPVVPALREGTTPGQSPPPVSVREYWGPNDETARERRASRASDVVVAALALGGLGILTLTPSLLLLTTFGVIVAGYARVATPPTESVSVSRALDIETPAPGTEVTVTIGIENTGSETLADLRVIDGVPPGLRVTEGSPRFTTALRPGKKASFTYCVEAVPGHHAFGPMLAITRDVTGLHRRESLVEPALTTLTCHRPRRPAAIAGHRRRTTPLPGASRSNAAGAGVEFHSVREYRRGDPLSRVHWKQRAKTGEFTTIDFDESRLTRVLVAVDTRRETYRTVGRDADTPLARASIAAAHDVSMALLDEQIPVGLVAVSPRSCWLAPQAGATHRARIRTLLTEDDAFDWTPPTADFDAEHALRVITRQTQTATQIVVVSPLLDDQAVQLVRSLDAHGYAVSVHSPFPAEESASLSAGEGYAVLMRGVRIKTLRSAGIHVRTADTLEPTRRGESS